MFVCLCQWQELSVHCVLMLVVVCPLCVLMSIVVCLLCVNVRSCLSIVFMSRTVVVCLLCVLMLVVVCLLYVSMSGVVCPLCVNVRSCLFIVCVNVRSCLSIVCVNVRSCLSIVCWCQDLSVHCVYVEDSSCLFILFGEEQLLILCDCKCNV